MSTGSGGVRDEHLRVILSWPCSPGRGQLQGRNADMSMPSLDAGRALTADVPKEALEASSTNSAALKSTASQPRANSWTQWALECHQARTAKAVAGTHRSALKLPLI